MANGKKLVKWHQVTFLIKISTPAVSTHVQLVKMESRAPKDNGNQVEFHRAVATEHEIEVEDKITLIEKKIKTTVSDENGQVTKTILDHTRSMVDGKTQQDKSYVVREVTVGDEVVEHDVTTTLTSSELEDFKKLWEEKWCPSVTEEKIEQITESLPYEVEELTESKQTLYERTTDRP